MRRLVPALLSLSLWACDPGAKCPQCPEATPADCPKAKTKVVASGPAPAVDNGDIKLTFAAPKSARLKRFEAQLSGSKLFGKVVDGINETIALPRDGAVLVSECGRIDAYYDPKAPGVVVCYELAEHFESLFKGKASGAELERMVTGAVFFAFLHELGHALVDQLQLPITGKEEDAVDQLASVILIESGSGIEMALDGGRAFLLNDAKGYSGNEFWSEHSFEKQRYYAIVCMAYGAAPKKRGALTKGRGALPQERARSCPAEYKRIKTSWQTLLAEHAKTG
ncbi:MAG: DUF4344 domain-containing metallopeptidase [Nannocystaceae bacterium]|nr:DUF4344 domain-containing metallopeptidase [bacterium]